MCGETRVGPTGIVWRCVREVHTEPEEVDQMKRVASSQPVAPPQERHHFRAVRKED